MFAEQRDMRVPSELVPRCPVCGKPMAMNLRADDTFVQDEGWYQAQPLSPSGEPPPDPSKRGT